MVTLYIPAFKFLISDVVAPFAQLNWNGSVPPDTSKAITPVESPLQATSVIIGLIIIGGGALRETNVSIVQPFLSCITRLYTPL